MDCSAWYASSPIFAMILWGSIIIAVFLIRKPSAKNLEIAWDSIVTMEQSQYANLGLTHPKQSHFFIFSLQEE